MTRLLAHRDAPVAVAAVAAMAWVLWGLDVPLVEDSLFWWVPKGLLVAESGPARVLAGDLPAVLHQGLTPQTTPPQWAGGLPDYAHPTLWYTWLGLFLLAAPTVEATHLACLVPAVAAAVGLVRLGERLGSGWAGLAALLLPPVFAQGWRPELDLPLLATVPWALVALIDGAWPRFALLGTLAVACKEPGVLLAAPACWRAFRERRWRWMALVPLGALLLWGLVHPEGLARPETLPTAAWAWLSRDLPLALRLVFIEQGRFLLLLLAPLLWRRWRDLPQQIVGVFGLTWVLFFSVVGFSTGDSPGFVLTHVRYFVPGMAALAVLLASARAPLFLLALPGLLWAHARSPYGPEASLWGIDVARAEALAAPAVRKSAAVGEVWVGSFQAAGLTQPWAGRVDRPVQGFRVYGAGTLPSALSVESAVFVADYGEPAGRLERGLTWTELTRWTVHEAHVVAYRVTGHKPGGAKGPQQRAPQGAGPVPAPTPPSGGR